MTHQSLSEKLRERLDSTPDECTLAWWKEQFQEVLKGYRGATHGINMCLAESAECLDAMEKLLEKLDSLNRDHNETNAKLGKLQEEFLAMKERQDKMADWLKANVTRKGQAE